MEILALAAVAAVVLTTARKRSTGDQPAPQAPADEPAPSTQPPTAPPPRDPDQQQPAPPPNVRVRLDKDQLPSWATSDNARTAATVATVALATPYKPGGRRASGPQVAASVASAVLAPSPATITAAALAVASVAGRSTDIGDTIGQLLAMARDVRIPNGIYPELDAWRRVYVATDGGKGGTLTMRKKLPLLRMKTRKGIAHWLDIPEKAPRETITDAVLGWPKMADPAVIAWANWRLASADLKRELPEE